MKRTRSSLLLGLLCGIALLLSGCLFKSRPVPTRHFVLAPAPALAAGPGAPSVSVEVGFVKMPAYLLRDSMVVRKSATELEYLENALWAERLDRSFQQTLAENVSALLRSNQVDTAASLRERVVARVSVDVKQFDVDTQGRGTLLAWWRLTLPGRATPTQRGETHLTRAGPAPLANPQAIATTLSALTTEFSQQLAQALRDSAAIRPQQGPRAYSPSQF